MLEKGETVESLTDLAALVRAWPQAQVEEARRGPWVAVAASSTQQSAPTKVPSVG